MRHTLLLFTSLVLAVASHAQRPPIPGLIDHLLTNGHHHVTRVTGYVHHFIPEDLLPGRVLDESQHLIPSTSGLYVQVDGTGILFQIGREGGKLTFQRQDSIFYMGNAFYPILFSVSDTLYSLGGYGFWRNNGILRQFNPYSHDWVARKTDRELEMTANTSGIWVDEAANALYVANMQKANDAVKGMEVQKAGIDSTLWRLDLSTGDWGELGSMTTVVGPGYQSPWGLFYGATRLPEDFRIADFRNNRILEPGNQLRQRLAGVFARGQFELGYFVDSTFFFGRLDNDSFDSLSLSMKDFVDNGQRIINSKQEHGSEDKSFFQGKAIWIIVPLVLIALGLVIWRSSRSKQAYKGPIEASEHPDTGETIAEVVPKGTSATLPTYHGPINKDGVFSQAEKNLLELLLARSTENLTVGLDEINRIIGVSGKNETVQKKHRSDVLISINRKWAFLHGSDAVLILRKRSEFDGRYFEYFLNADMLDKVRQMLA